MTKSELLQRKAENNLPDPELNGGYEWGQSGVGDKWNVGISQSFEWPGVYQARNKANNQAAIAAEARIRSEYADKMLDVKLLMIQYVAAKQKLAALADIKAHIAELNQSYRTAYEHGETTVLDLNKSAIELAEIKSRYNAVQNELATVIEAIQKEAGQTAIDGWLEPITQYPMEAMLTEDEYAQQINTIAPSLQYADALAKAAVHDATAVKRSATAPGFSVGYSHIYEQGESFNGVSVGVTLPVFSARNKYKSATYKVDALNTERERTLANLLSDMKSCRNQALRLSEQLSEISPVVLDQRPAELLHKALKGGEISLLTYLQEINYFLEAQLDYTDMLCDYHKLMACLNRYECILE
jgi:outer membrane protein TolC